MQNNDQRSLTMADIRTLSIAALGGALEFYDFIIYVFFAITIGHLFFPPGVSEWLEQLQVFGIFAAGYFARPLGGMIMAHFGDRKGRKKVFLLSILLMAMPTLIIGLMPTYATIGYAAPILLLIMRVCQGAAIGGEVPGAWVFVCEHVPANKTGFACGLMTAGLASGILLGSLVALLINSMYTTAQVEEFAWRIPFIIGGIFGFITLYLRRWLKETPVFEAMRKHQTLSHDMPLRKVLREHKGSVIISMLATWMLTAVIVVMLLMTPTVLQRVHNITPTETFVSNAAATLCLAISAVLFGILMDRFGALILGVIGCLLMGGTSYALYVGVATDPSKLLLLYIWVGIAAGMVNIVPYVIVHSFPSLVRFSGVSFSYNIAYAISGGVTPLAVQTLLVSSNLGPAHYVAVTLVIGLAAIIAYAFRTHKTNLEVPVAANSNEGSAARENMHLEEKVSLL